MSAASLCLIFPAVALMDDYRHYQDLPVYQTPTLDLWRRYGRLSRHAIHDGALVAATFSGSLKEQILMDLGLPASCPGFFLSPIAQTAQMHSVSLLSAAQTGLTATQAIQMAEALNAFWQEDAWQAHVFHPYLWWIETDQDYQWTAPSIWDVRDQLTAYNSLIEGRDAARMRHALTELQMFFHTLGQRVHSTVNAVWIWPSFTGTAPTTTTFLGNAYWLPNHPACAFEDLRFENICLKERTTALVYDDVLAQLQHLQDIEQHRLALQYLDEHLFKPAYAALQQRKLAQLTLLTEAGQCQLTQRSPRAFWRRPQPFQGFW